MAMDSYEGYQTHFGFDHFELEPMAFSRLVNNPYSNYYDLGWRNHHNFSWQDQATRNSALECHEMHNQAYPQFNNQAFYPPSNFLPSYQQWQSTPYCADLEDNWQTTNLIPHNSLHNSSLRPHHLLGRILTFKIKC
jgi:hypothetical protein